MDKKIVITKPILKWVGGKTQIIDKLLFEFPSEINNYHEIFLGGGSVLLALLSYIKNGNIKLNGNIYAYDLNEALIYVYKNIQSNYIELYNELQKLIINYSDNDKKEDYYYYIRNEYNKIEDKTLIITSAMFIFLNKTCFRGLFRIGPNGFNVPYGNYKNPEIININHLEEVHNLIKDVIFICLDFTKSIKKDIYDKDDFIYLDPPYASETDKSFIKYTEKSFNNHIELFNMIHELTNENIKIILSNSDVELVRNNFINDKYEIKSILCKRTINSKNPNSKTKEVIIKNY